MKRVLVQFRAESALLFRNGEQLLLTLIIPVVLLGFFGSVSILPAGADDPLDFLVPGVLAVAIMSASMVSLGIATGFERSYLVLKRLGATPLTRGELIAAKSLAVATVEMIQFALILPLAALLGWTPGGRLWPLIVVVIPSASLAFAGIGLCLAGRLRAEVNLAAQNGVYLLLLLLGGTIIPPGSLPDGLASVTRILPSHALAELLASTLSGQGALLWPALTMLVWSTVAPVVAAVTFRWS